MCVLIELPDRRKPVAVIDSLRICMYKLSKIHKSASLGLDLGTLESLRCGGRSQSWYIVYLILTLTQSVDVILPGLPVIGYTNGLVSTADQINSHYCGNHCQDLRLDLSDLEF